MATTNPTTADLCLADRFPTVVMVGAEADPYLVLPAPVGATMTTTYRRECSEEDLRHSVLEDREIHWTMTEDHRVVDILHPTMIGLITIHRQGVNDPDLPSHDRLLPQDHDRDRDPDHLHG